MTSGPAWCAQIYVASWLAVILCALIAINVCVWWQCRRSVSRALLPSGERGRALLEAIEEAPAVLATPVKGTSSQRVKRD